MWWSDWLYFQHLIACMGGRAPAYLIFRRLHSIPILIPDHHVNDTLVKHENIQLVLCFSDINVRKYHSVIMVPYHLHIKNFNFEKLLWILR